jgi:hypothetical protein
MIIWKRLLRNVEVSHGVDCLDINHGMVEDTGGIRRASWQERSCEIVELQFVPCNNDR